MVVPTGTILVGYDFGDKVWMWVQFEFLKKTSGENFEPSMCSLLNVGLAIYFCVLQNHKNSCGFELITDTILLTFEVQRKKKPIRRNVL
jgi:hypothetical protein